MPRLAQGSSCHACGRRDDGVEQSFLGGAARVGVTWFHRDTRNQIDFDLATFTYANIASTRAQGLEFELALRPVAALTIVGNYTYTDTENRSPGYVGKDLQRRPRDTASVSADWRTPLGLSLGATVTIVGDSFNDVGNFGRLDGYALAGIRAKVTERFSLRRRLPISCNARGAVRPPTSISEICWRRIVARWSAT